MTAPGSRGIFDRQAIRGARVFLRPMEPEDVELLHAWAQDGEMRRLSGSPPRSLAERKRRFEEVEAELTRAGETRDTYLFTICLLEDGRPIGRADLFEIDRINGSAQLGIAIGVRDLWGQGYGSDAVNALVDFAFGELRLERVWLGTDAENARAQRAYAKAGFTVEARLREAMVDRGRLIDEIRMAILREEWQALSRPKSWDYLEDR